MTAQAAPAALNVSLYENLAKESVSFNSLQEHALVMNNLLLGLQKMMTAELNSGAAPLEDEGTVRIWLLAVEKLSAEVNTIYPDRLAGGAA